MIAPRIPRIVRRAVPKLIEGMSVTHLKLITQLHCCRCLAEPPVHYHHLLRVEGEGVKGMSRKHKDRWTIPLCSRHHLAFYGPDAVHSHGDDEEFLATFGIDARDLAMALWAASPDLDDMNRVNFNHYQRAALTASSRMAMLS